MKKTHLYPSGTDMSQFKRIKEVSEYNRNFYVGFNGTLLYAESDDDDITEWSLFVNNGFMDFIHLGYSRTSEGNILVGGTFT